MDFDSRPITSGLGQVAASSLIFRTKQPTPNNGPCVCPNFVAPVTLHCDRHHTPLFGLGR